MRATKVDLREIVDGVQSACNELTAFLDLDTGKVVFMDDELTREDYDDEENEDDATLEDLPEWRRQEAELARLIRENPDNRFVPHPDQFDAHEWQMMARFAGSVQNDEARERLKNAIHGRGAFRMFKDALGRLGLIDEWHSFKDSCYRKLTIEWCEENEIEWVESKRASSE